MATTELQATYTSLEIVERDSNGRVKTKEPDSRSSEVKSQNLMSKAKQKDKLSNLRNINWLRGVEIFILSVIILVVWTLYAIPTIIYAQPQEKPPKVPSNCDQMIAYNGETCSSELQYWQQCFSQQANADIYVPSDIDQQQAERNAKLFFFSLPQLSPRPECVADLRPFLCLYLFGSCDSNNKSHQVTQADCERLRDDVCAQEWAKAESFLGRSALPQCSDFPNQEELCPNKAESDADSSTASMDHDNITTNISNTVCAENYYLNKNGSCLPLCILWVDPPGVGLDANNIAILISVITAELSAIVLLIISFSIQRKFMWLFPTFYLNYICITVAAIALPILVGFMVNDKESLFCTSKDLITVLLTQESTIYCTIAGVILIYGLAQLVLWVTFHAISLCWGILFPFHFRRMKVEKKLKYIHITTVLAALLLPTIPSLLLLKDGYTFVDTPATFCAGRSSVHTFYALILPLSILLAIATSALVIMFWVITKEFVLKKLVKGKQPHPIRKAQVKILFIVCYYIITAIIALMIFVDFEVGIDRELNAIIEHFSCQSTGMQMDRDCGESISERIHQFSVLAAVSTILVSLLPAVVLVFGVKCECKTKKVGDCGICYCTNY